MTDDRSRDDFSSTSVRDRTLLRNIARSSGLIAAGTAGALYTCVVWHCVRVTAQRHIRSQPT